MALEQARKYLEQTRKLTVLTGAGVSAESGIPTFRGSAGLWKQFRPEDLATSHAFNRDPELVWQWYKWRRSLIAQAKPNPAHLALAELEQSIPQFTLITQNVDGLHQEAGSQSVLEIHGSIWRLRCTGCRREWLDRNIAIEIPPRCECGAMARPAVVWFGENLPQQIWTSAEQAVQSSDVFLVVGTSAVVYPAASLVPLARSCGSRIIEINMEETSVSGLVDCTLRGRAAEILPPLIDQLHKKPRAQE